MFTHIYSYFNNILRDKIVKGPKCYWIRKQIEPFHIHYSKDKIR